MKLTGEVIIRAPLIVDSVEAEIINHLCSYDVAKIFADKFSHKYSEDRISMALTTLRNATARIIAARDSALAAISKYSKETGCET